MENNVPQRSKGSPEYELICPSSILICQIKLVIALQEIFASTKWFKSWKNNLNDTSASLGLINCPSSAGFDVFTRFVLNQIKSWSSLFSFPGFFSVTAGVNSKVPVWQRNPLHGTLFTLMNCFNFHKNLTAQMKISFSNPLKQANSLPRKLRIEGSVFNERINYFWVELFTQISMEMPTQGVRK